ncbi:MAG: single-stranded DNA-binding protein [Elusimicrobiota bacterium]
MADLRIPEQNHILLTGRLTHDPDLRFTQKGQPVCSFDIAVNRRYKDATTGEWKDDTTFVPIVVWSQMGERCKERLKKGSPVHVEGRLSNSEYTDKNGQKHRVLRVVARRVQFLAVQRTGPVEEPSEASETTSDTTQTGSSPEKETTEIDEVPF